MRLVDFHCHLDLYQNFESIVEECEKQGIYTLAVTTTPYAWPRNHELTKNKNFVRSALGLHPQLVGSRPDEFDLWLKYFPFARYIGEVGLDASPAYYKYFEQQKILFQNILQECAKAKDKIISVHSVRTASLVLDMVEKYLHDSTAKIILHWFTGNVTNLNKAVRLGCYFSINSQMLRSEAHRELIRMIPIESMLTETDGPFTNFNGQPAIPANVVHTLAQLSDALGISQENLADKISANLQRLETNS